jgi:hypothetical protein
MWDERLACSSARHMRLRWFIIDLQSAAFKRVDSWTEVLLFYSSIFRALDVYHLDKSRVEVKNIGDRSKWLASMLMKTDASLKP